MLEALPLLATTFVFISIFLYIFTSIQLHDIRTNWNERRCELLVMLIAKSIPDPNDSSIDADDFAADNFSFCIQNIIAASFASVMGPAMGIFSKQVDAIKPIQSAINNMKNSASNIITNPFNSYMNGIWKKFKQIIYAISTIFIKMSSAFHRIFGIVISTIFAGISMYKGIINTKNFIIKICIIILYIIIALLFLLFIPLLPIIPIVILPTITVLALAGAAVGGMDEAFNCVAPGTLVACKDGWKAVETLHVGDELREGRVTGILQGIPGGSCVSIGTVVISGLHIVYDTKVGEWVHARDHSSARPATSPDIVYCLTTSNQTWTVEGELLLRDWTDIPNTNDAFEKMENFVWNALHEGMFDLNDDDPVPNKGLSLLGGSTRIIDKYRGYVPIYNIKVHDYVFDGKAFTEVLGVFTGIGTGEHAGSLDTAWIWNQTRNRWVHPILKMDIPALGYNIITRSGKFSVAGEIRRDLTEIGCERLYETRDIVLSLLNNRNDEEECIFA